MESKYFKNRIAEAHQEFLGASGQGSQMGDEFMNMFGNDAGSLQYSNFQGQDMLNAAGGLQSEQDSQPYEIIIENTTTANISDVTILNSAAIIGAGGFTAPAGTSITYALTNVTYSQFLAQVNSGLIFNVGQLRLEGSHPSSTTTSQRQAKTTVKIETKDINGNAVTKTYLPKLDSYQQISTQTDVYYNFLVNAMTSVTFGVLYALATLTVTLYPAAKNNQFKQLQGADVTRYRNPQINPFLRKIGM